MDPRRVLAIVLAAALIAVALVASFGSAARALPPVREAVATGLDWPVGFVIVPADGASGLPAGAIVYNERLTGNLRAITPQDPAPGRVLGTVTVSRSQEQGLLGLALPPDFAATPYAYAFYTYANATAGRDMNRVVRWWLGPTAPPGPGLAPMEVVLDGIPASLFHNGGVLGFGPDGTLFVATGDATVPNAAQDNGSLSGKVLRLHPDGSIPSDNPLPGSPVYTLGHRNVFGLAFHPATGRPYVSENGPSEDDEVNLLEPGRNYGWPIGTGPLGDPRFVDPILTYSSVIAPTGLAFYTGDRSLAWREALFLGDWIRGDLHRIPLEAPGYRGVLGDEVVDSVGPAGILDIEDGPDGDLYISTRDAIYRVRDASTGSPALAPIVLLVAGIAALVAVSALALWRERRRRGTPPAPPAPPPPT